jgi:hypothetical protein
MTLLLPELIEDRPQPQEEHAPEWVSPVLPPLRDRLGERVRIREVGVLTIAALIGYVWVAWWMRDVLHFFVNDALARSSDAVFVSIGRDPHLGAIGFFWPPLPTLIQIPLTPLLAPFARQDMAGPISSAVCMALTIPVLGRLCTRLGLSRPLRFAICAAFALNPVTIYYAGNGLSEACSFLFMAISMLGFLTFIQTRSATDLVVMSFGLSGAALTRLEAPALTIVLASVAAFEWPRWRRSLWTFTLIVIPPAACFLFWMGVQWVLLGSPTFFIQGGKNPVRAIWLPDTVDHPLLAFPWALHWMVVLGPALILLVLVLLWTPISTRVRGTIGILAGAAVFPIIQIYQVITHTGYGDPRYFVTAVLFAVVAVIWLAAGKPGRVRSAWTATGPAWNCALVGLLVLGGVTASRSLTSGRVTGVESECNFFDYGAGKVLPILGHSSPASSSSYCAPFKEQYLGAWQQLDAYIDRNLKPSDRILDDNYSNFYAVLWTHRADQFVVRNDRDWQKIVANPIGTVDYIVTVGSIHKGGVNVLPDAGQDAGQEIIRQNPSFWKVVAAFPGGADFALAGATPELFKYIGPPSVPPTA